MTGKMHQPDSPAAGKTPTDKQHPEDAWESPAARQSGGNELSAVSQTDRDEEVGNRALHKVAPMPNPAVGRGAPDKSK